MEAEDPLSDLADIHLPDAVSFWPPALGWWLVAALLVAGLAWVGLLSYRRWQRQQELRMALREVEQIRQLYATWQQDAQDDRGAAGLALLHGCNSVLKRVALVHYPEQEVASLNGGAWLRFLDRSGSTDVFSVGSACVLGDGSYRRAYQASATDADQLVRAVEEWIKRQYRLRPATKAESAAVTLAEPQTVEAQA